MADKEYKDKELVEASQIAYIDLDEIYEGLCDENKNTKRTSFTLQEMYDYGLENNINVSELGEIIENKEVSKWEISKVIDKNDSSGMYGCIIDTGEGNAIVAFRGSESLTERRIS